MMSDNNFQECSSNKSTSGIVLLPVPHEPIWFEVEGIEDWSIVGNSWFEFGIPLLERFRTRQQELELRERLAHGRKILIDCAKSLLRYRRRLKMKRKIKKTIPTFIAASQKIHQLSRRVATTYVLQIVTSFFLLMVVFQTGILIHSTLKHVELSLSNIELPYTKGP